MGLPYSQKSDIWSLGCIAVEFLNGQPIFPAKDEMELLELMTLFAGPIAQDMVVLCKKRDMFFDRQKQW
jgi:serine/threonine protein kinase